jgi:hypothetical protein
MVIFSVMVSPGYPCNIILVPGVTRMYSLIEPVIEIFVFGFWGSFEKIVALCLSLPLLFFVSIFKVTVPS